MKCFRAFRVGDFGLSVHRLTAVLLEPDAVLKSASSSCQERDGASTYVGDFQATMEGSRDEVSFSAVFWESLCWVPDSAFWGLGIRRCSFSWSAFSTCSFHRGISGERVLLSRVGSGKASPRIAHSPRNRTLAEAVPIV